MRVTMAAVAVALTAALTCVTFVIAANAASAATRARSASASTSACYDFAVSALRRHVVVHHTPPACTGLAPQQVNETVALAIRTVVGPLPKAAARQKAVAYSRYLASLVRSVSPGRPAVSVVTASPIAPTLPARIAALAAWLTAAIPGAWLLAGRLSQSRRRGPARRAVPWVPLTHAGLASAGLALWVAFMVTSSPLIGWLDVATTWLIAGLGMSTLLADPTGHTAGSEGATVVTGTGAGVMTLGRGRVPVLTIALHGALAATTMALVLYAVLGVG